MAKYEIKVEIKTIGVQGGSWEEKWDHESDGRPTKEEFEIIAGAVVDNFNDSRRIDEKPRELVHIIEVKVEKNDEYVKLYEWSSDT
jgi:hypothetical protein